MPRVFAEQDNCRGTNEGDQLKVSGLSGFEALYGGMSQPGGMFYYLETSGCFWASTLYPQHITNGYYRRTYDSHSMVCRQNIAKNCGMSVRCIKDQ